MNPRGSVRFELTQRLGQGGAGSVWRARMWGAHGITRVVALKVVSSQDEGLLSRLRDEARLLAMLDHRALVRVHDLFELEGGRWGVAMELLEGSDLHSVAASGPVPIGVLLDVVSEVSDALVYALNAPDLKGEPMGLTHRDIKPANLLLCADGRVKLLDFGVARANVSTREAVTMQGELWGTLGYMSPERLCGACSPAVDVYALGVVFFELALRQRFGRAGITREEHERRLREAQAQLSNARVPEACVALILDMLSFDAEQRPSATTVRDRARDLRVEHPSPPLSVWAARVVDQARIARAARLANRPAPDLGDELWTVAPSGPARTSPEPTPPRPVLSATPPPPPPPPAPPPAPRSRWASPGSLAWLLVGLCTATLLSWLDGHGPRCLETQPPPTASASVAP